MLPNLYRIRQEHYGLIALVEESDGELTEVVEKALRINEKNLQEAAVSYAGIIKYYQAAEEAIGEEIKRLQELKKKAAKREELFRRHIAEAMNQFRTDRIESPFFTLSFRKATSVLIEDERLISPEYLDVPAPVISKTRIKEALQEGKPVGGASLVVNRHLQIK